MIQEPGTGLVWKKLEPMKLTTHGPLPSLGMNLDLGNQEAGTSQGDLPPLDDRDFQDYDDLDAYLPYLPDYDAIDEEEFDFGEGHVSIVHESIINAQKAAMAEYQMIRGLPVTQVKTPRLPKKGQLIIVKDPVVTYCVICNADVDHETLHCKNDKDESGSHGPQECSVCLKSGHMEIHCPYQYHVPKGAEVGPGGVLVCVCCNMEGGHPGKDDWVGRAVVKKCHVPRVNNARLGTAPRKCTRPS